MPKKAKLVFRETKGEEVDGWRYSVYTDGLVTVGTAKVGPHRKWTFRLTNMEDEGKDIDPADSSQHKECVRHRGRSSNACHSRHSPLVLKAGRVPWQGLVRCRGQYTKLPYQRCDRNRQAV